MAEAYASICGFRSLGERKQFQRFNEVLPGDHILDHNFYIFQKAPMRMWEIDFCVISESRIFLIEHKGSSKYLSGADYSKVVKAPERSLDSLDKYRHIPRKKLPHVYSAMIIDRPWKSEDLSHPLAHCVNSREHSPDTELFYKEVMRKVHGQRTVFDRKKVYELVTGRQAEEIRETRISDKTFDIFDQIADYSDRTENGITFPEPDIEALVRKQIDKFGPLHLYASDILNQIDESRQKNGRPMLFLHRPDIGYMRKFRPVHFFGITESEEEDVTSHVQLAFHIGRGDKFNLSRIPSVNGLEDSRLPHIAVKLAIFNDMDANRLSSIIEQLKKEGEEQRLRKLIFQLNANTDESLDPFYFVYSKHHYKESAMEVIDKDTADKFLKILKNYNKPEYRCRDFGFVKYFFYEKPKIKSMLKKKNSSKRLLGEAFEKLLPLYDFIMGYPEKTTS